ncbi:MAG: spermidine dehydrogenase, partial [Bacteroidia bacterium]
YGSQGTAGPAIFFDRETYGQDKLVIDCSLRGSDLDKMADKVNEFPLSKKSRSSLEAFCRARRDVTDGMSPAEKGHLMHGISYIDFLRKFGGLTEEAAEIFVKTTDGFWGVQAHSLSVTECTYIGLPINHLLGEMPEPNYEIQDGSAMFPDGNASIARLLVRGLIPGVAAGTGADNIVSAVFDYERLDEQASPVRLRLNSTVVSAKNNDQGQVETRYVRDGNAYNVRSRHCVLACYHVMIPHICPEMPEAQKEAQRYQVKRPLLLTNVLLRNSKAADKLGISGAYCPGRIHGATWLVKGVHAPDYRHEWDDDGSVVMMFWGMPETKRELDLKAQFHESRSRMVQLTFEDFEREVRTVLDRILGPGGFDVKRDILAITVNRWPHGYAHDYLDLWDPDFPEGEAPNEIARKAFGNIAIANSDAGADAYTHVAIDEAWRAVNELSDAGAN